MKNSLRILTYFVLLLIMWTISMLKTYAIEEKEAKSLTSPAAIFLHIPGVDRKELLQNLFDYAEETMDASVAFTYRFSFKKWLSINSQLKEYNQRFEEFIRQYQFILSPDSENLDTICITSYEIDYPGIAKHKYTELLEDINLRHSSEQILRTLQSEASKESQINIGLLVQPGK